MPDTPAYFPLWGFRDGQYTKGLPSHRDIDDIQSGLIILISVTAALFFAPIASQSALLVVPDEHATIQSAFHAAAPGDSIMVRAGTYVESLALAGKDVTVFGESGAEATVITTNTTARVLEMGAGISQLTIVSDLTIRDGRAEDGGGILLKDGASPILRRDRFLSNFAWRLSGSTWGGAIRAGSGSRVVVEDCLFQDNGAEYRCCDPPGEGNGGAISASSGSEIRVTRTTFVNNSAGGFEGGFGGGIHVASGATAVIEDCLFRGNGSGGVGSNGEITVERCVFEGNTGYTAAAIAAIGGRSFIRGNLFFDNDIWGDGGVISIHPTAPSEFSHNTVVFNTGGGVYIDESVVRNNIIASNSEFGLYYKMPAPGSITCNDVWDNAVNYAGVPDPTGAGGNISLDPRFCDPPARDLHLRSDSPCAPGASDCLLIGALDVGCVVSSVNSVSEPLGAPHLGLRLSAASPNPSRGAVTFDFSLPSAGHLWADIFDVQGRFVRRLVDSAQMAGHHAFSWDGRNGRGQAASQGVYFVSGRFERAGQRIEEVHGQFVLVR